MIRSRAIGYRWVDETRGRTTGIEYATPYEWGVERRVERNTLYHADVYRGTMTTVSRSRLTRYRWRQRLLDRVVRPVHAMYPGTDGVNLLEQDWDTLVILDACRADLFEEVTDDDSFDEYRRIVSLGSHTGEWGRATFDGTEYGDTVYVTANPYASRTASGSVHALVEVWHDDFDDDAKTVLPGDVVDAALDAYDSYPDKRLVVHFMQPHHPFVTDDELDQFSNWNIEKAASPNADITPPHDPFDALGMELVSRQRVWDAYRRNLEFVLAHAYEVAASIPGRTVLTADHGNLLGERAWPVPLRVYGHPRGVRAGPLITVPYAVLDDERRRIVDDGVRTTTTDEAAIDDRLRLLGYRE